MFQFSGFPSRRIIWYCHIGFPHSDISGSKLICSSPKLFAACHVLHRLLMPRHSPCTLFNLNFSSSAFSYISVSLHRLISLFLTWVSQIGCLFRYDCSFSRLDLRSSRYPTFFEKTFISFDKFLFCHFDFFFLDLSFFFIRFSRYISLPALSLLTWWARVDSNHRPRAYQARALTTWATSPFPWLLLFTSWVSSGSQFTSFVRFTELVEIKGIEPLTPCLQGRCSPSWAKPPFGEQKYRISGKVNVFPYTLYLFVFRRYISYFRPSKLNNEPILRTSSHPYGFTSLGIFHSLISQLTPFPSSLSP